MNPVVYPHLKQKIHEFAEGDEGFRVELTNAIFLGLIELKKLYSEGYAEKDAHKIQQIRHKNKTTLKMFGLDYLSESLQEGRQILESIGFGVEFDSHFIRFIPRVELAIEVLEDLLNES